MSDYFGINNQVTKRSAAKSYGVVFLLILAFIIGWRFGGNKAGAQQEDVPSVAGVNSISSEYKGDTDFQLFWDLWQDIKENYVHQPVNDIDLYYGAMQGILAATGDQYSGFFTPEMASSFDEELSGTFSGIGVEIGRRNDVIVVIAPLEGSPGAQAGLKPGDIIVAIDGEDALNISLDEAVSKIRGEEGTSVTITVISKDADEPRELTVTRNKIEHVGMRWEFREDGIAHLRLSSFDSDTENLLNLFIREVQKEEVKGIVLDLRNNPGGFLEMSIEVASEWIENGVIVKERDLDEEDRVHQARGKARLAAIPTVVLVNQGSASASEIVAGALQDYGVATLVGEQTFGKGSVQKYDQLQDGSAYRLTVAVWLTPNDRQIDKEGIAPDILIEMTEDDFNSDRDPQLDKAIELLNN